jgi:hypothetical protein
MIIIIVKKILKKNITAGPTRLAGRTPPEAVGTRRLGFQVLECHLALGLSKILACRYLARGLSSLRR